MFKNIKISTKITGLIVIICLITLLAISLFTYQINENSSLDKKGAELTALVDYRAAQFNYYFDHIAASVAFFQHSSVIKNGLSAAPDSLVSILAQVKDDYGFQRVLITDPNGGVKVDSENKDAHFAAPERTFFSSAAQKFHLSSVKKVENRYIAYAGAPLEGNIIIFELDFTETYKSLEDVQGLGTTGEAYIGMKDSSTGKIIIGSPLRNAPGEVIKFFDADQKEANEIVAALDGKNGIKRGRDYRGKDVLVAYRKVEHAPWAMLLKMDIDEITSQSSSLTKIYVIGGIIILLLASAFSVVFARSLTQPLNSMQETLDMVSKGILPDKITASSGDEFGLMANKVDG
ncbi:MAG: cache and HAMP domain-containing protein, partial [Cyclobacteriaceae bacterium]|nr:cache and HAMP domain-containing protein [Cyclobacteriaceae bacterium]